MWGKNNWLISSSYKFLDNSSILWFRGSYHVAFEDVVHDFVSGQSGGVYQELKGELQTGVHLAPSGLPLTFFPPTLQQTQLPNVLGSVCKKFLASRIVP
jgi:hypothetical protein